MRRRLGRLGTAFCTSSAVHAALLLLFLLIVRSADRSSRPVPSIQLAHEHLLVWLTDPGRSGGGGGGGNEMSEPPRRAELPGSDRVTVPAATPAPLETPRRSAREPNPLESLLIAAAPLASSANLLPGAIDAPDLPPAASRGSGTLGGAGTGDGAGDGPGSGLGLGPGRRRGLGDDDFRIGSDVTPPIEIRRGRPQYTADAVHARIQGSILVDCIVETDGACGEVRVRRSPDPAFGLDEEALKAARQWRFRPGTRRGIPVPVRVTIEVTFTIR